MMKNSIKSLLESDIALYYNHFQQSLDHLEQSGSLVNAGECVTIRGIVEGYKHCLERIAGKDYAEELFDKYDFGYNRIIEAGERARCGKQAQV